MFENDNDKTIQFFFGLAMVCVAIVMLLLNIDVTTYGFLRFGPVSSGPVLVIALLFLVVWAVVSNKRIAWILAAADIFAIIISVLLGTSFVFRRMNALSLIVMAGIGAIGAGLIILSKMKKTR